MEIRHFQHVLAVAEEGHFGRAAVRLGMRQPPLTQSIQRIERKLGVLLFERTTKGAHLTAAGRALLPEARAAVSAARRAEALARAASPPSPVRIGFATTTMWGPLQRLVLAASTTSVPVELIEATTNEQLDALASGRIDFGLLSPPFAPVLRMQVRNFSTEPVMAAVPAATAGGDGPVPAEVLADRFMLFPQHKGPTLHGAIIGFFAAHGLTPTIVHEVENLMPALALVAIGLGSTLVPAGMARGLTMPGVAFRPVLETFDVPVWPMALAHMPLPPDGAGTRLLREWDRLSA